MENSITAQGERREPVHEDTPNAEITAEEHAQLVDWFEESEEMWHDAREASNRDRDYYDNKQLTDQERKQIEARGQPPVVMNEIAPKVNFWLGLESNSRSDPKAYPRNPQDEDAAQAATDALRYVEEREDLDQILSTTFEDMLIEGMGGIEVGYDPERNEVRLHLWRFDRLFADPHSSRHDFSDGRYKGGVLWMDKDQAFDQWDEKKAELTATMEEVPQEDYADKPWKRWTMNSSGRDRVRVVQIYWQSKDGWKWSIFTKGGVLEGGLVPFVDSEGESECPLEMQSCYIDRENNRYGIVRALIDPQDERNKRRSKLLHQLSQRQTIGERGAVDDVDVMKRELAKPDGHIEVNPGFKFDILQNNDMSAGQAQLMQESKEHLDDVGANNSLRGITGNSSGKAIVASQQGGQLEMGIVQDRHRSLKLRVYRQIWNRIRQYWDEERWVRVTDNDQNVRFAGLNRPVTLGEKLLKEATDAGLSKDEAMQQISESVSDDQLQQVVGKANVPAEMDMDIILDTAPDTVIIQQEQFEELTKVISTGLELNDPRMRLLIQASQLRDKQKLLESLDQSQEEDPAVKQMQELQMQMQAVQLENAQLTNQQLQMQVAKLQAEVGLTGAKTLDTNVGAFKKMTEADKLDGEIDGMVAGQPLPNGSDQDSVA